MSSEIKKRQQNTTKKGKNAKRKDTKLTKHIGGIILQMMETLDVPTGNGAEGGADDNDSTKPARKISRVSFSGIDVTIPAEDNAKPQYEPSKVVFSIDNVQKNVDIEDNSNDEYNDFETDGPKRPPRQRRSGVVNSTHMNRISSAQFLDNMVSTPQDNGDSGVAVSDTSDCENRSRKTSFDSEEELGQINSGFDEEENGYLDNITLHVQNIIEDAKESELKNGNCKNGKSTVPKENEEFNGITSCLKKESSFARTKKDSVQILRDKPFEKAKRVGIEDNVSEDSFQDKPLKSSLAAHLRKDSIALTSEKMSQIRDIQRQYAIMKKENSLPFWKKRTRTVRKYKLHIAVSIMFVCLLIVVSVGWHLHDEYHDEKSANQRVFFDPSSRTMLLSDPDEADMLKAKLGESIPKWMLPSHCRKEPERGDFTCLRWKDNAILRISYFGGEGVNCYNVTWTPLRDDLYPEDCFSVGSSAWYGPANTSLPLWPLQGVNFTFSSSDMKHLQSGIFNSVIENYWVSSNGVSIVVHKNVPLTIKWNVKNNKKICFMAKYHGDFYARKRSHKRAVLNYTICNGNNLYVAHKFSRKLLPEGPPRLPAKSVLQFPIWSIESAAQNEDIEEKHIDELANKLKTLKLNCSFIELDGQWENVFGDLTFDEERFPNLTVVSDKLMEMGYSLSLKFSPYFSYHSESFSEGLENFYFVKDAGGRVPGLIRRDKEIVTLLDVTNSKAESWIKSKMITLSSMYNIGAFHMSYVRGAWLPFSPSFADSSTTPVQLRQMFSELVTSFSDVDADVLDGTSHTQSHVSFVRVPSTVTMTKNGACLVGSIETALTFGIMGYPYVMADGNLVVESDEEEYVIPDRNLYIRWILMASFFPAMKYVIPPWSYDSDCVKVAQNASALHLKYTAAITKSLKPRIIEGEPIIRPLWWLDSSDTISHGINDEFMVGDTLLVAPFLCSGDTERDIYLPAGIWSDQLTGKLVRGKRWFRGYSATIYQIPHFTKKTVIGDVIQ